MDSAAAASPIDKGVEGFVKHAESTNGGSLEVGPVMRNFPNHPRRCPRDRPYGRRR
jgi:hypothetical protein